MPKAFVLVNVESGMDDEVENTLKQLEGVTRIDIVYGVYDLVVEVNAPDMDKLKDIVTWRIRKVNGIRSTCSLIVAETKNT